jgi:hypothetical protein
LAIKNKSRRIAEAVHLLKVTKLTYQRISEETGIDVKRVGVLGLKHRPKEVRIANTKGGRGLSGIGDRAKAAEMMMAGIYSHQSVSTETGVPMGSLNKVVEYAEIEKSLGLPITGRPIKKDKQMIFTIPETSEQTNLIVSPPESTITKLSSLPEVAQHYSSPYRLDYEFEESEVDSAAFIAELERMKQIVLAAGPGKVSYTIGLNIKGE